MYENGRNGRRLPKAKRMEIYKVWRQQGRIEGRPNGLSKLAVAKKLGYSEKTVYRIIRDMENLDNGEVYDPDGDLILKRHLLKVARETKFYNNFHFNLMRRQ